MNADEKASCYNAVAQEIVAVIDGESNLVARMATVSNHLHHAFDAFIWTGFYVVDPEAPGELVVGPYQGRLGCLRIPFGKGVCGTAAANREVVIVEDVHAFPGHITCDAAAASEIVLPVFGADDRLIAVLDIDSDQKSAFDQTDADALRRILDAAFRT
ncbi:MAG: GAF domain-containing protein [Pseudomonadota bacterium]